MQRLNFISSFPVKCIYFRGHCGFFYVVLQSRGTTSFVRLPILAPSWWIQSTVQPTSVNTAVKKGLPARTLCGVLHSSHASTSRDPTHTPAGSKLGVSSASHSRASRVRAWGGIDWSAVCWGGGILKLIEQKCHLFQLMWKWKLKTSNEIK